MMTLMRRLGGQSLVRAVNETWKQGDAEIDSMHVLALQVREQVARGVTHDDPRMNALMREIRATDHRLTALELQFSQQLGEGARYIGRMLLLLMVGAAAVLLGIAERLHRLGRGAARPRPQGARREAVRHGPQQWLGLDRDGADRRGDALWRARRHTLAW